MSIKDTKERIESLPDSGEFGVIGDVLQAKFVQNLSISKADLQTVCNNHTRLLTAAKNYLALNDHGTPANAEMVEKELKDAIAEAEAE